MPSNIGVICYLVACIILATCESLQLHDSLQYSKRHEIGKNEGNRQSRSQTNMDLAVRNDRFFMGSRYGKRSSTSSCVQQCYNLRLLVLCKCKAQNSIEKLEDHDSSWKNPVRWSGRTLSSGASNDFMRASDDIFGETDNPF